MSERFEELVEMMDRLREPGGCPWDREQNLETFAPNLREELEELEAAIRSGDRENMKEEVGDLIFNLIFVARLAKERGWFTIEDSLDSIRDKILRRHPHVFGDANCETVEEVLEQWDRIKKEEKRE